MAQAGAKTAESCAKGKKGTASSGKTSKGENADGANAKPKPSYKHIPHSQKPPHLVAKRNARERRRVQAVNQAFYKLRKCVPIENRNKRVSKVKTLQRAIDYIRKLERILEQDDNNDDNNASSTSSNQQASFVNLSNSSTGGNEGARQRKARTRQTVAAATSSNCDLQPRAEEASQLGGLKCQRLPRARKSPKCETPADLAPSSVHLKCNQVSSPVSGYHQPADCLQLQQPATGDPYFSICPVAHSVQPSCAYGYYNNQAMHEQPAYQENSNQTHWPLATDSRQQLAGPFTSSDAYSGGQHFYASSSSYLHADPIYQNQPLAVEPIAGSSMGQPAQASAGNSSNRLTSAGLNDSGVSTLTPLSSSLTSGESSIGNLLQSPSSPCSSSGASSSSSALAADLADSVSLNACKGAVTRRAPSSGDNSSIISSSSSSIVCHRPFLHTTTNSGPGNRQVNGYLTYAANGDPSLAGHLSFVAYHNGEQQQQHQQQQQQRQQSNGKSDNIPTRPLANGGNQAAPADHLTGDRQVNSLGYLDGLQQQYNHSQQPHHGHQHTLLANRNEHNNQALSNNTNQQHHSSQNHLSRQQAESRMSGHIGCVASSNQTANQSQSTAPASTKGASDAILRHHQRQIIQEYTNSATGTLPL